MSDPQGDIKRITQNVERVILGKSREVQLAAIALVSNGHLLIEDVPGTGKTILARALAISTGCTFNRLQFTPDLLPSDVTGVSIYNQKSGDFEWRPGPIAAQIVLADEINRATPKTQSALLEAMEERQVTVDGVTRPLPQPFMVMATQNPVEYEGTFPLPEAQLDRFLLRLRLGYPNQTDEVAVLEGQRERHPISDLQPVIEPERILDLQAAVRAIWVDPLVKQYIVEIASGTRSHPAVFLGASPRGSLALFRCAQAQALIVGRDYVTPDDVKELAPFALGHRIIVSPTAQARDTNAATIVQETLHRVPVPGARADAR